MTKLLKNIRSLFSIIFGNPYINNPYINKEQDNDK